MHISVRSESKPIWTLLPESSCSSISCKILFVYSQQYTSGCLSCEAICKNTRWAKIEEQKTIRRVVAVAQDRKNAHQFMKQMLVCLLVPHNFSSGCLFASLFLTVFSATSWAARGSSMIVSAQHNGSCGWQRRVGWWRLRAVGQQQSHQLVQSTCFTVSWRGHQLTVLPPAPLMSHQVRESIFATCERMSPIFVVFLSSLE